MSDSKVKEQQANEDDWTDEDSSGGEDGSADEEVEEDPPVKCLFCSEIIENVPKAFNHMLAGHGFNLADLQIRFNMDQYLYIKMINYILEHKSTAEELMALSICLWLNDKFLKPFDLSFQEYLTYDFEENYNNEEQSKNNCQTVQISQIELNQLRNKIRSAEEELKSKNDVIAELQKQVFEQGLKFREMLEEDKEKSKQRSVADRKEFDEYYFKSYSHFDIHFEMLSDKVRTNAYKDAIFLNSETFKDKIVMDLGCGTSILSMFCVQVGAEKVFAIDQSDIIYKAMDIAQENRIDKIEFIKGKLEELKFSKKVDILVSEWMGYFLIFEGMLDSVIFARDNILKKGGLLVPNRCSIHLVGISDVERYSEYIQFWDSVYGFQMRCMKQDVLHEASIEICVKDTIITEHIQLQDFNLEAVDLNSCNFTVDFVLNVTKPGKLTAFVGYFDTFFEMDKPVHFSTSPSHDPTHWKQTVFFLPEPVTVETGTTINGIFKCERSPTNPRSIIVTISVFDRKLHYVFE